MTGSTDRRTRVPLPICEFIKYCSDELLEDTMAHHSTFPRSHLLILGPNSIQSLLPVTPISQAEALLESHRIEDVILLADQQRKKVQGKLVADANEVCTPFRALCFYF